MNAKHFAVYMTCAFLFGFGLVNGPVFGQETKAPAANWCKGLDEASCTSDKACRFKPEITWSGSNGASRVQKASCVYDAKAARSLLASQFMPATN